jgi:hypothetical protein
MVPARTSLSPGVSCSIPALVLFKRIDQHERRGTRQRNEEQAKKATQSAAKLEGIVTELILFDSPLDLENLVA